MTAQTRAFENGAKNTSREPKYTGKLNAERRVKKNGVFRDFRATKFRTEECGNFPDGTFFFPSGTLFLPVERNLNRRFLSYQKFRMV